MRVHTCPLAMHQAWHSLLWGGGMGSLGGGPPCKGITPQPGGPPRCVRGLNRGFWTWAIRKCGCGREILCPKGQTLPSCSPHAGTSHLAPKCTPLMPKCTTLPQVLRTWPPVSRLPHECWCLPWQPLANMWGGGCPGVGAWGLQVGHLNPQGPRF